MDDPLEDEMSEGELEDEELTAGWEEGITDDGKVFYVCHMDRSTQWTHPKTNRMRVLGKNLPHGWVKKEDGTFYDTIAKGYSRIDPRLLRAPKQSDFLGCRERVTADGQTVRTLRDTFKSLDTADDVLMGTKLDGKVAIVTGANSGLGFETARSLAQHGARVIMACRCLHKAHLARKRITDEVPGCMVDVMEVDLASTQSIRLFAGEFMRQSLPLHILVCNAAVMGLPYQQTVDGNEMHFAVNHLAHFLLVHLLLPVMQRSVPCRVVIVTSEAHRCPSLSSQKPTSATTLMPSGIDYWPACAYNTSKLCNLLFMKELNDRYATSGIFCNAVHPGNMIATSLYRHSTLLRCLQALAWPFVRSPAQAAAGIVYCAAGKDLEHVGGYYFVDEKICKPAAAAGDKQLAEDLWTLSEELVAGPRPS